MALLPVAQAVTMEIEGPLALIAEWRSVPPAMLMIMPGTKKGDTRRGPFSIRTFCSSARRCPCRRCRSQSRRRCAGGAGYLRYRSPPRPGRPRPWHTGQNTSNLPDLRPFPCTATGSKSFTSAGQPSPCSRVVSKWVMGPMPHLPFFKLSQKVGTSLPMGVTQPMPVMTTLLMDTAQASVHANGFAGDVVRTRGRPRTAPGLATSSGVPIFRMGTCTSRGLSCLDVLGHGGFDEPGGNGSCSTRPGCPAPWPPTCSCR